MLPCLRSSLSTTSNVRSPPSAFEGFSADNTPHSSSQLSPTVNLTHEYTLAVQTNSYGEIWSKIHHTSPGQDIDLGQVEVFDEPQLLEQVLQPSHECVQETLSRIKPSTLSQLVSTYFEHSEHTSCLCLLLYHSVNRARVLYIPLGNLLDALPLDLDSDTHSLSESQCHRAFDIFLQYDNFDNPFTCPESHNFNDMRLCFSQLRQELDRHLRKSRSRVKFLRRTTAGSAFCLIAATVGVAISAVGIATHALVALVAGSVCPAFLPSKISKKELAHLAQLDAAAKGTYVLHNDLDTIDRLVARLHTAVEGDKLLIRLGLERGKDRHAIQEVVKQLRKTLPSFLHHLTELEEHLCLCFAAINRARALLLQEILLHETHYP